MFGENLEDVEGRPCLSMPSRNGEKCPGPKSNHTLMPPVGPNICTGSRNMAHETVLKRKNLSVRRKKRDVGRF